MLRGSDDVCSGEVHCFDGRMAGCVFLLSGHSSSSSAHAQAIKLEAVLYHSFLSLCLFYPRCMMAPVSSCCATADVSSWGLGRVQTSMSSAWVVHWAVRNVSSCSIRRCVSCHPRVALLVGFVTVSV